MEENQIISDSLDPTPPVIAELNDLANKSEAAQQEEGRGFMNPKPPKRGRGRPSKKEKDATSQTTTPKDETKPEAPDPMLAMLAGSLVNTVSATVVATTGIRETAMTDDESKSATMIVAALGQKYAPDVFSKYGLEVSALTIFGMYFFRVKNVTDQKIMERQAEQRRREEQAEQAAKATEARPPRTDLENHFPQIVN